MNLITAGLLLSALGAAPADGSESSDEPAVARTGLFGWPVDRSGFHFQVAFGIGGGPDTEGLFHAMEIGGTFENGWTVGMIHTFIQNKGMLRDKPGPDLIGGWMALVKAPIIYPEIVGKVAFGPGGTHEQDDGIKANIGFGLFYGVDLHLPFFETSGTTLGLQAMDVWTQGRHHFGAAVSLGYTFF